MISLLALAADADADGIGNSTGGVQIHVDITPLTTSPPVDGLAGTGADLPLLLIAAGISLLIVGAIIVARKVRNRTAD